jgi:sigma-B regulation protein RsbU (phosphoserine phosphatase)
MLPGNYIGLVIADVCDKGVGSALYMALFRSLMRVFSGQISLEGWSGAQSAPTEKSTVEIDLFRMLQAVPLTNDYISQEHGRETMFATLFFGILNPVTGEIAYINGGHEPLYIIGRSGIKETLNAAGPVVGIFAGAEFKIQRAQLEPGDILIGYTDGVTEALSPRQTLYSKEKFRALLKLRASSATELIERIQTDLFEHIDNAPQFDDITMIAVHRKPEK